ncbi:MAG: PhoH family protein [Phycisphaerales bacterium]
MKSSPAVALGPLTQPVGPAQSAPHASQPAPETIGMRLMPVEPRGGGAGRRNPDGNLQAPDAPSAPASSSPIRSLRATPAPTGKPKNTAASRSNRKSGGKQAPGARTLELSTAGQAIKTYVLDTNVLLHNPKSLFVFQENNVVIPFTVLEELDKFKGVNSEIGRNARECIRYLDRLRDAGDLTDGVNLGALSEERDGRVNANHDNDQPAEATSNHPSGTLRVVIAHEDMPPALTEDTPDHRIIAVAWNLQLRGEPAVFVSKDINARIKADALGIRAEDFENQKVNVDELYAGYVTLHADGALIDELYSERMLALDRLAPALGDALRDPNEPHVPGVTDNAGTSAGFASGGSASEDDSDGVAGNGLDAASHIQPNEYVVLIDSVEDGHTGLARRLADTNHVIPVTQPRKPTFGIMARNVQQTMALDLLLDDEVRMVTLIGAAGTGKTLLAVAAGMAKVFTDGRYEKLLVARPIMPMGRDIGFLPGDKDEKLTAWMQPIFDNLSYLLSTRGAPNQHAESHTAEQRIQKFIADGRLVLEPLTYIRGRSIPHQFMIVDEAQNLSPHEVKTIVSRVGEGTKIVFTGDIEQIDHPYLDASSNGLTYAVEKMKGAGVVGHVTLSRSERSSLASLATERL